MKVYFDSKRLPEFQQRSKHERYQALWQVGFIPYRHWQVWLGTVVSSLLLLLGFDAYLRLLRGSDMELAMGFLVVIAAIGLSLLLCLNVYFHYLRGYISQASFDPAAVGWKSSVKGTLPELMLVVLFFTGTFGIDWAINSVDENPDPRVVAVRAWPQPIPDEQNGYIAMAGMNAPAGTTPYDSGRVWLAAVNELNLKHALGKDYPKQPDGLKYVAFADNPKKIFCAAEKESCWGRLGQSHGEVVTWLAANRELLAHYQTLKAYARWQETIQHGSDETPIPTYAPLFHGQSLLQATAMLAVEQGRVAEGLGMIADDVRFIRQMLAEKNRTLGKEIGGVLLSRDLAWLLETLQVHSKEIKPYWSQIAKMVEPLTPQQISMADAFRFEAQQASSLENNYSRKINLDDAWPPVLQRWARLHEKENAYANLVIARWEKVIKLSEVTDANRTPPVLAEDFDRILSEKSGWTRWYYNQIGTYWSENLTSSSYEKYVNHSFDLNALNTLVRLRVAMLEQGVKAGDVPSFLRRNAPSLWNPETGKPFELDEQRKQIYFVPIEARLREGTRIGGVPNRVGVSVM